MKIRSFTHKGLRQLYLEDSTKGIPPNTADKLRKMSAYLDSIDEPEDLRLITAWNVHTLTGNRKGTWSLYVTRNRRLTSSVDTTKREVFDVNLEDYH